MDSIIINAQTKEIYNKKRLNKEYLRQIVLKNIKTIFNFQVIENDYVINKETNDLIETLALDENYQLVLIEYRVGYNTRLINNGLFQIDYILSHLSEFKILLNDKYKDIAKQINYNPRLVIVSDNFNKNDGYSISKLPYDIDLVSLKLFENNIIEINKIFTSRNIYVNEFKNYLNSKEIEVFNYLNENVLSLGEEISINTFNKIVIYRKIKTFMYVIYDKSLKVIINGKIYTISSIDDVDDLNDLIEESYDK